MLKQHEMPFGLNMSSNLLLPQKFASTGPQTGIAQ
ncbi:unnamed protein product [Paramecium octaurelia]|uniref:Uncharacterized protein n=1 Tax=Paramecium octaurelia TaxID=43137 RepID=A0A8S1Y6Y4_PAROT|nr:unnamed protein product [Paramecium octaurelia]